MQNKIQIFASVVGVAFGHQIECTAYVNNIQKCTGYVPLLEGGGHYDFLIQAAAPDASNNCATVVLGVGTNMWRDDYLKLGQEFQTKGISFIAFDFNVGLVLKTDPNLYKKYVSHLMSKIDTIKFAKYWYTIPYELNSLGCTNVKRVWYLGGHSAGAQAAHNAILLGNLPKPVSGFVGLDGFNADDATALPNPVPSHVPLALHWGFPKENAINGTVNFYDANSFHSAEKCGYGFYLKSKVGSRFYPINTVPVGVPTTNFTYKHCDFADEACKFFNIDIVPLGTERVNNITLLKDVVRSFQNFFQGKVLTPEEAITTSSGPLISPAELPPGDP